jgi:hypothetical protein
MISLFLTVTLVCLVVGVVASVYWGVRTTRTLRRTRQTICPRCPGQHRDEGIPTACRDAMVLANGGSSPRSRNIMSICVVNAGR